MNYKRTLWINLLKDCHWNFILPKTTSWEWRWYDHNICNKHAQISVQTEAILITAFTCMWRVYFYHRVQRRMVSSVLFCGRVVISAIILIGQRHISLLQGGYHRAILFDGVHSGGRLDYYPITRIPRIMWRGQEIMMCVDKYGVKPDHRLKSN